MHFVNLAQDLNRPLFSNLLSNIKINSFSLFKNSSLQNLEKESENFVFSTLKNSSYRRDLNHLYRQMKKDPQNLYFLDKGSFTILVKTKNSSLPIAAFDIVTNPITIQKKCIYFDLSRIINSNSKFALLKNFTCLPEYLNSDLMSELCSFLSYFFSVTKIEFLMTQFSLNSNLSRDAALIYRFLLHRKLIKSELTCHPKKGFHVPNFEYWNHFYKDSMSFFDDHHINKLIPHTFSFTINLGAYISGVPCHDIKNERIDFLTILTKDVLNSSLWKNLEQPLELAYAF